MTTYGDDSPNQFNSIKFIEALEDIKILSNSEAEEGDIARTEERVGMLVARPSASKIGVDAAKPVVGNSRFKIGDRVKTKIGNGTVVRAINGIGLGVDLDDSKNHFSALIVEEKEIKKIEDDK